MSLPLIESVKRCTASPAFMDRFYELFLSSDPRVAARFEHTDFARQKYMLGKSLMLLVQNAYNVPGTAEKISAVARSHGPEGMDIPTRLYGLWLEALLQAVRESDTELNAELAQEWRRVFSAQLEFLLEKRGDYATL